MADKEREYWEEQLIDVNLSRLSGRASKLSAIDVGYVRKLYSALKARKEFRERLGLSPIDIHGWTVDYARRLGATNQEAEDVVCKLESGLGRVKLDQDRPLEGLLSKIKRLFKDEHK